MSDWGDREYIRDDDPDPCPCDGATWRAWDMRRESRRIHAEERRQRELAAAREREAKRKPKAKPEPQQKRLRGVSK